jgi:hypothetical protein
VGFLGLRKPKWKHADPEVRLRAVAELDDSRQEVLRGLALEDAEPRVRAAAANRVAGAEPLTRLLERGDEAVRRIARERLSGVAERVLREQPLAACAAALEAVNDQKSLAELVLSASDTAVRSAALAKMLAVPEPSQALLATIAIQDARGEAGAKALERISERRLLRDVARKAKHEAVRAAASERAERAVVESAKPSSEQSRKARLRALEPLIAQATRLAVAADQEAASREWTALESRWRDALALAEGVPLEDAARALAERFERLRAEASRKGEAERERIAAATAAREAFLAELSAAAAASAPRTELMTRWFGMPALPDARRAPLESRFQAEIARLFPAQAALPPEEPVLAPERAEELGRIAEDAERLSAGDDFRDAMPAWHRLHKRWLELSAPLSDAHPLKRRFLDAYAAFKDRRREARERRVEQRGERVARLRELVASAEALAAGAAATSDAVAVRGLGASVRELQAAWKAVGPVPPREADALRARFRAACDVAYAPVAASREAEDWERSHHLAKAEELTVEIEALGSEQDLGKVAGAVKRAHQAWKALGQLPRDRQQAAWLRFKAACDAQFDRCRPFFAEQDAARMANLERKRALVAEVQALATQEPVGLAGSPADLAARRAASERVKAIQAEWKTLGPVPREHDRETWRAWRAAGDAFFAKVRQLGDQRRQEEQANLEKKQALCGQAEEFAARAEASKVTHNGLLTAGDIARFGREVQERFRAIGFVPREEVEALRTRFRAACDRIWATIREEREAEAAAETSNLEKKLALIKEVEEILANPNPRWFKDEVRELTRRFRDIGHVPRDSGDVERKFDDLCRKVMRSE